MSYKIKPVLTTACLLSLMSTSAQASSTGMPWETGVQSIFDSLTGPLVGWIAVIVIIIGGLALAFGNMEGGAKKIIGAVIGIAVVAGAPALAVQLGVVAGAVI
jgi:type IV secretion system protein VirB2